MDFSFMADNSTDFDSETYIKILIAIAKTDKDNGPREFGYVRNRTRRLGADHDRFLASTDKTFDIKKQKV